jgi:lysine 2,3-aminomutase
MSKNRLKSAADLQEQNHIDPAQLKAIEQVARRYAVGVTEHVHKTIKGPVASDPVAKQYIPQLQELKILPGEDIDPIGDNVHTPVKGIVHRYPDRVLYKITSVCAVYCRYCFRREMIGPTATILRPEDREAALEYIRTHTEIWEVILTGGDPFILSPRQLSETLDALCDIPHVQVIRIHTRVPAADPVRITTELCKVMERDKAVYIAVHINHAQEITTEVETALRMLHKAGCVLLSQSVLLKGVNDDAEVLETLFRRLAALRVKPYYLHHPDLAPGTSHFRLSIKQGQAIMKKLLGRMSGICLPAYMLDIPGGHGKVPINACYAEELENGAYALEDFRGGQHRYEDGL